MKVFQNDILEQEFREQGYVVIDLLDQNQVQELQNFYSSSPEIHQSKYTTFATNDETYKRKVNDFIKTVVGEKASAFLSKDMKPFWGNYMYKAPSENTNMPLHVDWQYVDEPAHVSLNLWAPLIDTDIRNGALHVVPKSHHVIDFPRGIELPRYYEKNEQVIKDKYGKIIPLKAGEAIIYDHRLLHYSLPNLSGKDRLAVTLVYCPENVELGIYFTDDKETHKYFIADEEVLLQTEYFKEFKGFSSKKSIDLEQYDNLDLLANLDAYFEQNKPNFFDKIKMLLLNKD